MYDNRCKLLPPERFRLSGGLPWMHQHLTKRFFLQILYALLFVTRVTMLFSSNEAGFIPFSVFSVFFSNYCGNFGESVEPSFGMVKSVQIPAIEWENAVLNCFLSNFNWRYESSVSMVEVHISISSAIKTGDEILFWRCYMSVFWSCLILQLLFKFNVFFTLLCFFKAIKTVN